MTPEQIEERAQIIDIVLNDSDAVCDGCGANPREAADGSPAVFGPGEWFLDAALVPDPGTAGEMLVAQIRCPRCSLVGV